MPFLQTLSCSSSLAAELVPPSSFLSTNPLLKHIDQQETSSLGLEGRRSTRIRRGQLTEYKEKHIQRDGVVVAVVPSSWEQINQREGWSSLWSHRPLGANRPGGVLVAVGSSSSVRSSQRGLVVDSGRWGARRRFWRGGVSQGEDGEKRRAYRSDSDRGRRESSLYSPTSKPWFLALFFFSVMFCWSFVRIYHRLRIESDSEISHEDVLICIHPPCRMATAVVSSPPAIHGLWKEYVEPSPKRWNLVRSYCISLGFSQQALIIGVEVQSCGQELRVVAYQSERYKLQQGMGYLVI
ncbi:hypothetical protein PR202_gb28931 [Eleusine coracana subsp. coracana]|uniref:Uncharacterized protein n=1 Tax=Eleusine coracana subsp. coracana TaxID=191504 RepID=A0AAV5FVW7_ELECO|nr:hypothetical protein PR202_gb28931 [Eleusine coracana subsp. coracana]